MKVKAKSFSKKSGQKLKIKQVTSSGIKKKDKNKSVLKHMKQKPQLFLNDDYLNAKEEEENEEEEDENEDKINSDGGSSDDNESINGDENEDLDHKKALKKLQKTDPEFYKFLEENDKSLLDFNVDDDDDDDDEDNEDEDNIHKPPEPGALEVHSDEDDFEDEKVTTRKSDKNVTLKMVKQWHDELTSEKSLRTIETVVKAFHAALVSVTGINDDEDSFDGFKVEGSAVFNAVVQLCVLEFQPALVRFLNLPTESGALAKSQPAKTKKWSKVKTILKYYFTDLLKLLSGVTSDHILCVMLKHVHQMTAFVCYYQRIVKLLLRRLVNLWSESTEETVRVLAFLCILRIATSQQRTWLEPTLKMMYKSYISNSKFVSPSTLPGINFMRRSLAELFSIDSGVSYQHAFLYIRQLAVHLRNAIIIKKKEFVQAVYNWQFVSSLRLWVDLLCANHDNSQLEMLLYPLVQVIIGCIKLTPTAQYYPLRFHCCEMLIDLSRETGTYIPVLPFILEVLSLTDFDKGHKKLSMKPMDMTCLLRLSKSMLNENSFKDAAIEYVFRLLLNYLATESHRLSFPDLTLLPVINLKQFFKKCKSNKYVQKLRGAMAKIEENSKFIESERKKVTFSLDDKKAIEAWEKTILIKGTPLNTYYSQLKKIYDQQEAKRITQNDKLAEFKLPVLKKGEKRRNKEEGPGFKLPTDDDDDSEDEESLFRSADDVPLNGETKIKKSKETKKKKKKKTKAVKETSTTEKNNDVHEPESDDDDDDDKADDVIDFELSDSE